MKRSILLLVAAAVALGATGCATRSPYLVDRKRDAKDIFTCATGKGAGIKLRVSFLSVGLFANKDRAGLRGGILFVADEDRKDDVREWISPIPRLCILPIFAEDNFIIEGESCRRGKNYNAIGVFVPFATAPHGGGGLSYAGQVEVAVGLGGTVRLGFNVVELADFVLGWTTLDFLHDDVARACQAEQQGAIARWNEDRTTLLIRHWNAEYTPWFKPDTPWYDIVGNAIVTEKDPHDLLVRLAAGSSPDEQRLVIEAVGDQAGIIVSDQSLPQAPEDGYQSEVEIPIQRDKGSYRMEDVILYVTSRTPPIYSRVGLKGPRVREDLDLFMCYVDSDINPYGSRILVEEGHFSAYRKRRMQMHAAKALRQGWRPEKPQLLFSPGDVEVRVKEQESPDETLIRRLAEEPPSIELLREVLSYFPLNRTEDCSYGEAHKMLEFIGAAKLEDRDHSRRLAGVLGSGYEVTLWHRMGGKPRCYGVRFGIPGSGYAESDQTYFEICK